MLHRPRNGHAAIHLTSLPQARQFEPLGGLSLLGRRDRSVRPLAREACEQLGIGYNRAVHAQNRSKPQRGPLTRSLLLGRPEELSQD